MNTNKNIFPYLPAIVASFSPNELLNLQEIPIGIECIESLSFIDQGSFECQLNENSQIKLCQYFTSDTNQAELLQHYLKKLPFETLNIINFLQQWADSRTLIHQKISEIYLQFHMKINQPSAMFFSLPQQLFIDNYSIVKKTLNLLVQEKLALWEKSLAQCFRYCPESAVISHIGIYSPCNPEYLEIKIQRLRPDTFRTYLHKLGLVQRMEEAQEVVAKLFQIVDQVNLSLQVSDHISPEVSLEGILFQQPINDSRWEKLCDFFVAKGWCEPKKRSGLLNWSGEINPTNTKTWAPSLLCKSLLGKVNEFSTIQRRLSSINTVIPREGSTVAKATLFFEHRLTSPQSKKVVYPYESWNPSNSKLPYQERVKNYFESTSNLYFYYLGPTFQGWLFQGVENVESSNRNLAERAHLQTNDHILDAGCGACGPAVDIAQAYPKVTIECITNSPTQVKLGQQRIREFGLADRISVRVGDYHTLPWENDTFDRVLFLESTGHTEDPHSLFAEVRRVLKPKGCLYIKDAFKIEEEKLSPAGRRSMAEFDRLYVAQTRTIAHTVNVLEDLGFLNLQYKDLTGQVEGNRWRVAMTETFHGQYRQNPFGIAHQANMEEWPVLCGEIIAYKA